jgi:hypothetical protein
VVVGVVLKHWASHNARLNGQHHTACVAFRRGTRRRQCHKWDGRRLRSGLRLMGDCGRDSLDRHGRARRARWQVQQARRQSIACMNLKNPMAGLYSPWDNRNSGSCLCWSNHAQHFTMKRPKRAVSIYFWNIHMLLNSFGDKKNIERERAVVSMDALGTRPINMVPRPDDFIKTRRGSLLEPK